MAGDGKIVIDVVLEDGSVAKGVADLDGKLKGLGGSGEKASLGIGKIVTALGLTALASKGIDMVKQSLDGAISRYDTLNQFPRVLEMMGFDAQQSQASIDKLSDGIQGLPTRLDAVASTAQNIAVMTGDLEGATDITLALNNAFLSSGASASDAERGLTQYVQMLSRGEVDLDSWRTLQETMGPALNKTAEAFGFLGESAQNDLYAALKEGDITFADFNSKLIELDGGVNGFAATAEEGSKGIETSWLNVKTAIVNGVASIIGAIDEALSSFGGITGVLDTAKKSVSNGFKTMVEAIPPFIDKVKEVYETMKPWLPLLTSVAAGIVAAVVAYESFVKVKAIIDAIKGAQVALNTVIALNPWVLVVAAVVAAVALIYFYWEPISEFFMELWEGIKTLTSAAWDGMKEKWQEAVDSLKQAWSNITEFFTELWDGILLLATAAWDNIKETFQSAINFIDGIVDGGFSVYLSMVGDYMTMIWDNIKAVWDFIKDTFINVVEFLAALVSFNFEGMKEAVKNQMEAIKKVSSAIWENIKTFFGSILTTIWNGVKDKFEAMKNSINEKLTAAKTIVTNLWTSIKTATTNKLIEVVSTTKEKFAEVYNAIKEKLTDAVKEVGTQIGKMPGKVTEKIGEMTQVGKDLIKGLIKGIKNMATDALEAITGVVDGVVNKAKSLLGIKSPSRVFMAVGEDTVEGFEVGVKIRQKHAEFAVKNLFDGVLGVTKTAHKAESTVIKKNNAEIKKLEERASEDIYLIKQKALKAKRKLTEAETVRIRRIEEDSTRKILALKEKSNKEEEKLQKEQEKFLKKHNDEIMKTAENHAAEMKKNGKMSLQDEIYFWDAIKRTAKNGSDLYNLAINNHQKSVKELRGQIESVNKEYNDRMLVIDKEYNDESQKLHDEWNKAYESRMNQLLGFAGIFDEFKKKTEVTGQDLITNLESQVGALDEYSKVIGSLGDRIDDDALFDELKSLGVKSLGELQALNSLSDAELEKYAMLYRDKFRLAKEQTDNEMKPMTDDIDEQLIQLKKDTSKRLDELNKEWQAKIKQVVHGAEKEFDSMRQVGIDAMQGLSNGMASMKGQLQSQAQSIAQSIKDTIQSAFDINSPSRWMRDMIGRNMMLGWIDGIDGEKSATLRKAKDMTDWMKPKELQNLKAPIGRISAFGTSGRSGNSTNNRYDQSRTMKNDIDIHTYDSGAKEMERTLRRLQFGF